MKDPLFIRVEENQQPVYQGEVDGRLELGRQDTGEEGPYFLKKQPDGSWRLVVARGEEVNISRHHILVEGWTEGKVRLQNLREVAILVADNVRLEARAAGEFPLPLSLSLGRRTVILNDTDEEGHLQYLAEATIPPSALEEVSVRFRSLPLPAGIDTESIFRWLKATMGVLNSASNSQDYMEQAAQAVLDLVGLDTCRVLLLAGDQWRTEVTKTAPTTSESPDWRPSRQVLTKVRREKKTFWQMPNVSASLKGIRAVVAAPILNRAGEVVGAVYGDRRLGTRSAHFHQITNLEATLVELLASSVAAGLARAEQEKAALTARVQFEQFFTPTLSRQLASQPDLLKGRESEVSVLFGDIYGFSRISERLGPTQTVEWINDVMGALSDCVLAHQGVLVDYIGDMIMAMWGAPEKQTDHAKLACRAAVDMLEALPRLNVRWQNILGEPIAVGIGISSGPAWVGNAGSYRKFKFAPLGNTVNVASRVQGATKFLKAHLLVTGLTQAQLDEGFSYRRLGKVRMVNIDEPVELYEVVHPGQANWPILKQEYETALAQFEAKELRGAARILGELVAEHPGDGPSIVLLSRVVNYLVDETHFNPVWQLAEK
jgi:adenylate cyclase